MALESLWATLNAEVSGVSRVQATVYAGLKENPALLREVSGVSSNDGVIHFESLINRADTSDTPSENVRYQPQPAWTLGCTLDTPATPEKIANEHKKPWQLFGPREPVLSDSEHSAARAYHTHRFSCCICIAAGRGIRYGRRCAVGLALWIIYSRGVSKSTIE
jgi:hypothetical protein